MPRRFFLTLTVLWLLAGCQQRNANEFWIYTSIYRDILDQIEPLLKKEFPEVNIQWNKGGSEEIATRVNTELLAGGTPADIIMTSDPFWYHRLKKEGLLLPYASPLAQDVPASLKDPDQAFTTVRLSTMVLTYNTKLMDATQAPQSFQELADPKWRKKVVMPDPLKSGTTFTSVAFLSERYGWGYFTRLHENEMIASGGNSAVMKSVESQEYPVGMVLLENILKARQSNSPTGIVYPGDGAILIPGPIAIMKSSPHPELAKKIYDFFLSEVGQQAMIQGYMHSPKLHLPPPKGARPLHKLMASPFQWSPAFLEKVTDGTEDLKEKYSNIMLK